MDDTAIIPNPLGSDVSLAGRSVGALVSVEQQRAIAEVQARMIIARSNPRDPIRCMDLILQDCTRPTLAEGALYQYARGGTAISGPSIRLAETLARRWGNIAAGIKEIARQNGYSECVAYAWDLETGYYDERQFQVRHWRDTKGGGYQIKDERDIYELIANMGQRRKRAVLLSVIPGDVTEAATQQCEETLKASADATPEAIKKMIDAFGGYGVTKEQIETRCQCHAEAIRPAQLVQLRKIYASIKDGMSDAGDWFAAPSGDAAAPTQGTAALRDRLAKGSKPADPAKVEPEPAPKPAEPPQERETPAPAASATALEPEAQAAPPAEDVGAISSGGLNFAPPKVQPAPETERKSLRIEPVLTADRKHDWRSWTVLFLHKLHSQTDPNELPYFIGDNAELTERAKAAGFKDEIDAAIKAQWDAVPA